MDLLLRRRLMMIPKDSGPKYLKFTGLTDDASVKLTKNGTQTELYIEYTYNGSDWSDYSLSTLLDISNGKYVMLRRKEGHANKLLALDSVNDSKCCVFVMTGQVYASGDLMSILDGSMELDTVGATSFHLLFDGCSQMVHAPKISATIIENGGLNYLFNKCTGLTEGIYIHATSIHGYALNYLYRDCSGIENASFATISGIQPFRGCSSLKSITVYAETPPEILNSTFTNAPAKMIIYVPADSVDAYKSATYWSDRASYIQAIP